jgi:hypothetical protein
MEWFRLEGRIERLRVQLAYGFEARTQHQLSSSWHVEGEDGIPRGMRLEGRIERLRVQLAYGFEARTQHQLSSSLEGEEIMRSLASKAESNYAIATIAASATRLRV